MAAASWIWKSCGYIWRTVALELVVRGCVALGLSRSCWRICGWFEVGRRAKARQNKDEKGKIKCRKYFFRKILQDSASEPARPISRALMSIQTAHREPCRARSDEERMNEDKLPHKSIFVLDLLALLYNHRWRSRLGIDRYSSHLVWNDGHLAHRSICSSLLHGTKN